MNKAVDWNARPGRARRASALLALPCLIGLLASSPSPARPGPTASGALVLDHVTVVDTRTGALARDQAVVIEGGVISRVAPAGAIAPGSGRIVNLRGKYVVPGYNDMHAHPLNDEGTERLNNLTLMLANGITGFRQMSGSAALLRERRDGTMMPDSPTPQLLATPGDVLIRPVAPTPEAAVAVVDAQKAQGADFIKVVDVSPPTFFAIGAEAKKVGLRFLGHLPTGVDALQASRAGFYSIEHLGPFDTILISCSSDEANIRAKMASRRPPPMPALAPDEALRQLEIAATEPMLARAADPTLFASLDHIVATYDDAKCRDLSRQFIANGTWQSPTLIRDQTIDFGDDPRFVNDPNLRCISAKRRALWATVARRFTETITPADKAVLTRFWQIQLRMLKAFDETGVPMIAGTDTGGQWDLPGFSMHSDFDLLAADGIAPLKILQMTTLNAATFLGREATMGSVAAGKAADLVVLDGDPTASARNLHRIAAVVRAGRLFDAAALAAMKAQVEARVKASAAS